MTLKLLKIRHPTGSDSEMPLRRRLKSRWCYIERSRDSTERLYERIMASIVWETGRNRMVIEEL